MSVASFATILFVDICQSTELYAALGDSVAFEYIHTALTRLTALSQAQHGQTVKNLGDGLMCVFNDPHDAVRAACAMQIAIDAPDFLPNSSLKMRIGIHTGKVIREGNDVYGDTVNIAARAMALAGERQIMATAEVIEQVCDDPVQTRYFGRFNIKGKDEKIAFHEIIWLDDLENITIVTKVSIFSKTIATYAEIQYQSLSFVLDRQFPVLKIGRLPTNNIVIPKPYVSKNHTIISFKNGKFFIADSSSNGTFIRMDNNNRIFIHHDEAVLLGAGKIFCGKDVGLQPDEIIQYVVFSP